MQWQLQGFFQEIVLVQLPTQSNCPRLQLESDGIQLLIKSIGERVDEKNLDPPCHEETKRQEQTGARGKDLDPHESNQALE
jgi:hypothetical protein